MKISAYNVLFLFIFLSCSSDTKFSDVSIGVTDFSHSKYHIKFKTDTDKEANISYWDNQNDKKITDNYPSDNYDIPALDTYNDDGNASGHHVYIIQIFVIRIVDDHTISDTNQ